MNLSLRNRLLLGIVLGAAALLGIFSVLIYWVVAHALVVQFDKSLLHTANLLAAVVEEEEFEKREGVKTRIDEPVIEIEFDLRMLPEFNTLGGGAYYQFADQKGKILARSPSLGKHHLKIFDKITSTPQFQKCILPVGRHGRAVGLLFIPGKKEKSDGSGITIVTARNADSLYNQLRFFRILLLTASTAVIVFSLLIAHIVTRTTLRPIRALADKIEKLDAENINRNHIATAYPAELLPVVSCLNNLLERIRIAFQRQRQFNADVAHELRTPVTGLRTTIEVALSKPRTSEESFETMQDCLKITKNMHSMIETLLTINRIENPPSAIQYESVNVNDLLTGVWIRFAERAKKRNLHFENRLQNDLSCISNKEYLSMVFSNLFDNAVEYTDENGQICIEAKNNTDELIVFVSNTGCRLKNEDADRIFDPFWRGDKSRRDTGIHSGIGLSLAQRIIILLGGKVSACISDDGVLTIRVQLCCK